MVSVKRFLACGKIESLSKLVMPSQGINLIVALIKEGTALARYWFTVVYIITFKVTHT